MRCVEPKARFTCVTRVSSSGFCVLRPSWSELHYAVPKPEKEEQAIDITEKKEKNIYCRGTEFTERKEKKDKEIQDYDCVEYILSIF